MIERTFQLQTRWAIATGIERSQRSKRELRSWRRKAKAGNWRIGKRYTCKCVVNRRLMNEGKKKERWTSEKVLIIRWEMFSYDGRPSQLNARRMTT